MKKFLTFCILLSFFVVRVVGASYQCVRMPAQMSPYLFGASDPVNTKQYPNQVVMGYSMGFMEAVIQGHCDVLNDTSTSPLEYNMSVQGIDSMANNCWCQVVYPYVSEISYLQQITGYLENCIASCSKLCAANWGKWMRNRPSPIFDNFE
ncbi:MAG: hypothetical protein IKB05_03125 [Alphaproteobacteria bacterium]|nr:hypothetical protein [Alphaproteobacteria bacterium]